MTKLTAHFAISTGTPSQHYTDAEAARMDARDYDVTITIGSVEIEGGITLYRDDGNGGIQGTCGTPRDGWCSGSILQGISTLTEKSQREILSTLAHGEGSDGDEIALDSEPTAEELGADDAETVVSDAEINGPQDEERYEDAATVARGIATSIRRCGVAADESLINAMGWREVYKLAWLAYDDDADRPSADALAWCERYSAGYLARLDEIAEEESSDAAGASA